MKAVFVKAGAIVLVETMGSRHGFLAQYPGAVAMMYVATMASTVWMPPRKPGLILFGRQKTGTTSLKTVSERLL